MLTPHDPDATATPPTTPTTATATPPTTTTRDDIIAHLRKHPRTRACELEAALVPLGRTRGAISGTVYKLRHAGVVAVVAREDGHTGYVLVGDAHQLGDDQVEDQRVADDPRSGYPIDELGASAQLAGALAEIRAVCEAAGVSTVLQDGTPRPTLELVRMLAAEAHVGRGCRWLELEVERDALQARVDGLERQLREGIVLRGEVLVDGSLVESQVVSFLREDPDRAARVIDDAKIAGPWEKDGGLVSRRAAWDAPAAFVVHAADLPRAEWSTEGEKGTTRSPERARRMADVSLTDAGWVLAGGST